MIEEKDVHILDEFIKIIIDGQAVYSSKFIYLPYFEKFKYNDRYLEFERLAMVIHEQNVAKVFNIGTSSKLVLRKNHNTLHFKEDGGFVALFEEQENVKNLQEKQIKHTTINAKQVIYNEQSNNGNQSLADNFKTSSLTQNTNNKNEKKPKTNWTVKTITLLIFPIVIMLVGFSLKKCDNTDSTKSSTPIESNVDQKTKEMKAADNQAPNR